MMRITFNGKEPDGAILISATGLDAEGNVSAEDYYQDGGSIHVRLGVRTVRLVYAVPESEEDARKSIYEVYEFRKSGPLAVRTDGETWTLTGEVSGIEGSRWTIRETVEVTITCADPWFYAQQKQLALTSTDPHGMLVNGIAENPGDEVGFTAKGLGRFGSIVNFSTLMQIAWNIPDTSVASLTLVTAKGNRNLYDPVTGISYAEFITTWGWPTLAHGESTLIVSGGVTEITFIPRRSGL